MPMVKADLPPPSKDCGMHLSHLEETLAFQIRAHGLPAPERELRAIAGRKFRWDFAWPDYCLLVEVQGGIWKKSGHTTGAGVSRDCEKLNLATLDGWSTLMVTKEHIESGDAIVWIRRFMRRSDDLARLEMEALEA